MGAADVIPGVSGGTIAFISGIYQRLLNALSSIGPALWHLYRQEGFKAVWKQIDGTFLALLFGGILTSIVLLASVISRLLQAYPHLLWGFFFGLILGSAVFILRSAGKLEARHWVGLLLAAAFAWFLTELTPISVETSILNLYFGGLIAICAMILPGLSGSFLLLMLGLYPPIMDAIRHLDLSILGIFALGCATGLLLFSRLLSLLMARYYTMLMAVLTGLMIGALNKVWPWKETVSFRLNSHGEQVPLVQVNIGPSEFFAATGIHADITLVIGLCVAGAALVACLNFFGSDRPSN